MLRAAIIALGRAANQDALVRFRRDQSGSYLVITGLVMTVLLGFVGLGTEVGVWLYTHQTMQSAADSGAISAATAHSLGNTNLALQADAITASYGFVAGANGVSVTVNRPPQSGNFTTNQNAVEVVVQQPRSRTFSALWLSLPLTISARAVAVGNGGVGCVLSLNHSASGATTAQGTSTNVVLNGCSLYDDSGSGTALTDGGSAKISALSVGVVGGISGASNITTTQGTYTGISPVSDPYASVPNLTPTGPINTSCCSGTAPLNPGIYQNGMKLAGGDNITLNPGTYYIEGNGLDISGGATLTGTGVTLVFTSSDGINYASATVNGGATVNLTAPTSGPTAGIAILGDRNMPVGTTFKFNGGSSQVFGGAIYVPTGAVDFAGGANTNTGCTQLVANTIKFSGSSNFALNCNGYGTKPLGSAAAALVE